MKIIYGVCGEGRGHATRSRPIIEHLKKNHEVTVFAGAKAIPHLETHFAIKKITSMRMIFTQDKVNTPLTVAFNILSLPGYIYSITKILANIIQNKPDIIITDFEPWTAWAAIICRIPILSIQLPGHYPPPQLFRPNTSIPSTVPKNKNKDYWNFFKLWLVTSFTIPRANKIIIPSFFKIPITDNKTQFVEPIIREEIKTKKSKKNEHILVYQSPGTDNKTIKTLKQIQSQQFIVYGFPKEGIEGNLTFKKTNENEFFEDLATAKGIITNAGISLLTEAVYLGKPVLSVPIKGQSEQIVNAHYIQQQKNCQTTEELTTEAATKFIQTTNNAKKTKIQNWNNLESYQIIEKTIKELCENK